MASGRNMPSPFGTGASVLLTLPLAALTALLLHGKTPIFSTWQHGAAWSLALLFFSFLFFQILRTGKTDRFRAIAFVVAALLFCVSFISDLFLLRGHMSFSATEMYDCEIPFCHIVTTMLLAPAAIKGSLIFPGQILDGFAAIARMLVLICAFAIVFGRGFCSWGCFYGGWDDGFSRILKKPALGDIDPKVKYASFLVLGVVVAASAFLLSPFYCTWLCPFKAVTEYNDVVDARSLAQLTLVVLLFIGLVVVLPLLTKKRTQCAAFCPLGALLSLVNGVSLFAIRIDREKCVRCGACAKACPMLALDAKSIARGAPAFNCSKCGKCVDVCPKHAPQYHIRGTSLGAHPQWARLLFLYPAYLTLTVFCGARVVDTLHMAINLLSTGAPH